MSSFVGGDGNALGFDLLDFGDQTDGIDHHAVADDVQFVIPQDAGREEVQHVFRAAGDHRMAGVVAALATDHDIGCFREVIDDLAFSFVSPLETCDDGVH